MLVIIQSSPSYKDTPSTIKKNGLIREVVSLEYYFTVKPVKRSLLGQRKGDPIRPVKRGLIDMKYYMAEQEKGDLLIQVTA